MALDTKFKNKRTQWYKKGEFGADDDMYYEIA